MILHWYLAPTSRCLDQSFQTLRGQPAGAGLWKAEGRRSGAKSATAQGAEWGQQASEWRLHLYSPETSITFTNTYINTLHTSESGRQAPHRGSADTVTCLRNSRKGGLGSQKRAPSVFSCPGRARPSPPCSSGSVCPVWRVAIGGLRGLRLWLQGAGLAALRGAALGVLWQVVV